MPPKQFEFTNTEAEQAFPEIPLPAVDSENYPKRTARRKVFAPQQDAWIQMQTPQFHAIIEDVNRAPRDKERDEAMFKKAKILQYERKFPESERPEQYNKKLNQIFANVKQRGKTNGSAVVDDSPPFPSYMLLSGKLGSGTPSGYSFYAAKIRERVNDEVNEYRRENQIDQYRHASLLRSFSSRAWTQLSPAEQAQYAAEAASIKREQGASDDIYHLHAGPSFAEFLGKEESEVLENRWAQFAEENVKPNHPVLNERQFERNEAGHYLLVSSEKFSELNRGGHDTYLEYLRRYLDATWVHDFSGSSESRNAPLQLIMQAPEEYLHPALYDGRPLTNLETSHARLYSFTDSIVQFQSANSKESIFLPHAGTTSSPKVNFASDFTLFGTPSRSSVQVNFESDLTLFGTLSHSSAQAVSVSPVSSPVTTPSIPVSKEPDLTLSTNNVARNFPPIDPSLLALGESSTIGVEAPLLPVTPAGPLSPSTSIPTIAREASVEIDPILSSATPAVSSIEESTQPVAQANADKHINDSLSDTSVSAQNGVDMIVASQKSPVLKRKRGAEDEPTDTNSTVNEVVSTQAKKSGKGRKGSTKKVKDVVEVQPVEEDTGSRRTSTCQQKVKDPNADNKYTGSPEHKKKKKN
ncbi:hypothetical protein K435DRAFT_854466 [Dendrothele bispora CBS 962.96]|uniref:Uncharacterized protein n=1 Tax=Dendrothele bispora (strain CBS 962.96) TaxID=1314807 RepID=A0A4S8MDN1_DENBC|nr:hypothetical protein K435DRAFT_854466 [Dendrothele bispora CBS 962.96]